VKIVVGIRVSVGHPSLQRNEKLKTVKILKIEISKNSSGWWWVAVHHEQTTTNIPPPSPPRTDHHPPLRENCGVSDQPLHGACKGPRSIRAPVGL